MPGPHGFAVRFSAVRLRAADRSRAFRQPALRSRVTPDAAASTASPPYVRDVRETPLLVGRDGQSYSLILISEKQKYFCKGGWTRGLKNYPTGKSVRALRRVKCG